MTPRSSRVLEKMIKQRREAITQFDSGGRADLVAKETAEIAVLQQYLPAQMSEAEVDALIAEAIQRPGATSIKDMGKVMARGEAQGRRAAPTWAPSARALSRNSADFPGCHGARAVAGFPCVRFAGHPGTVGTWDASRSTSSTSSSPAPTSWRSSARACS